MLQHYFHNTCMKFFNLQWNKKVLERYTWKKRCKEKRNKERLEDFRIEDRRKIQKRTEQRKTIIYFTYFHS